MKQFFAEQGGKAGYRVVDNTLGWLTFFIAAFVYCSTIDVYTIPILEYHTSHTSSAY